MNSYQTYSDQPCIETENPVITGFSSVPHPNASGVVLLREGNDVALQCTASGRECYRDKPTFTNLAIVFHSQPLHSVTNASNISLELQSVKAEENTGVYTCKASLFSRPSHYASKALAIMVISKFGVPFSK